MQASSAGWFLDCASHLSTSCLLLSAYRHGRMRAAKNENEAYFFILSSMYKTFRMFSLLEISGRGFYYLIVRISFEAGDN